MTNALPPAVQLGSLQGQRAALVAQLKATAATCGDLSHVLAEHADRQRFLQRILRSANFVVGVVVVFFSLLALAPSFTAFSGATPVAVAAIVGAAFLLADAALPSILSEPNPDRFKDYATYIRGYAQEFAALQADNVMNSDAWTARANELIRLARLNVDDVYRQWPKFAKVMKQRGHTEYWQS